ncbi:MAG: SCO family protein [Bdellovibrionales bacterium]|nr:SCO family protein [Bdellovibrionales bacterium]
MIAPRVGRPGAVYLLAFWLAITMFWWAFAFASLPGTSPEWLEAARVACFGRNIDGLPDVQGWLMLVGAPLMLLAVILTGWRRDLIDGFRSIPRRPFLAASLSLLVLAAGWQTAWTAGRIRTQLEIARFDFSARADESMPETYPRLDREAPEFELVNQTGGRITLGSLHGKNVILTFAFAHCQTVCPALVKQSLDALTLLDPQSTVLVVITLDPWRDTPDALPGLASKWKLPSNAHLLSGDVARVTGALDAYQIPWKRDEKTGDIAHPALTYVLGGDGRIAYALNNAAPDWIAEAVRRLVGHARR